MGIRKCDEVSSFEDMVFSACKECGCVQLKNLLDPAVLYKTPHNPAIGKTWSDHNIFFSDYILQKNVKNILDIGGANLKIAKLVLNSEEINSYTIIDASDSYETNINPKIKLIRGFIENVNIKEKFDSVVMSHTFEHFYEPIKMLNVIRNVLEDNGKVIISVPNIENQLKDGFLNALNFEHTYYISHEYIKLIASVCKFNVIDITEYSKYNSFYTLQKTNNSILHKIVNENNASLVYENHIQHIKNDVIDINSKIKNKKVYCFGGHIFTQMLISFGLEVDNIICVLDNDVNKIGNFLYGTNLKIESPKIIKDDENPVVIVRSSQYTEEICKDLKIQNINTIIL